MTTDLVARWERVYGDAQASVDALSDELSRLQAEIDGLQALAARDLAAVPVEDVRGVAAGKARWEIEGAALRRAAREIERRRDAAQEGAFGYRMELEKARAMAALAAHKTALQAAIRALKVAVDDALREPGAQQAPPAGALLALVQALNNAEGPVANL